MCLWWIGLYVLTWLGTCHAKLHGTLSHVQLIHRHGDRSPVNINPIQESNWDKLGIIAGQLTPIGRQQTASLGKYLKHTYIEREQFLPPVYNNSHLHIRSTDVDRCLMSIQSILDELYHDTPIPVHVVPQEQDVLLQPTDKCASYVLSYHDRLNDMDTIIQQQYGELIHEIRQDTGWNKPQYQHMSSAYLLTTIHDNFVCEQAHHIPSPTIVSTYQHLIHNLTRRIIHYRFESKPDDIRGRVGDGLLLDLLWNVQNRITSAAEGMKHAAAKMTPKRRSKFFQDDVSGELLRIYSAHDTTLIALATALNIWTVDAPMVLPHYAASIILETRKDDDDEYYVNFLYGQPHLVDNTWVYRTSPLSLPCPDSSSHVHQCRLSSMISYIQSITSTSFPPPITTYSHSGCCVRDDIAYINHACNQYDYSILSSECQLWRRTCPHTSCEEGQFLESGTLACVSHCSASSSLPLRIIFVLTLFTLITLIVCFYYRRDRVISHARPRGVSDVDRMSLIPRDGSKHDMWSSERVRKSDYSV